MQPQIIKRHTVDFLFPIALFFAFALSALTIILFATNVYRKSVAHSAINYTSRTGLAYITEKVRQNDTDGSISVCTFHDLPALEITEEYEGEQFCTIIYAYDGALRECFISEGLDVQPEAGTKILEVQDFRIEALRDDLIRVVCTDQTGETVSGILHIRSNTESTGGVK